MLKNYLLCVSQVMIADPGNFKLDIIIDYQKSKVIGGY
jgi:hypothetical protein